MMGKPKEMLSNRETQNYFISMKVKKSLIYCSEHIFSVFLGMRIVFILEICQDPLDKFLE